jgi:hypothetical protein
VLSVVYWGMLLGVETTSGKCKFTFLYFSHFFLLFASFIYFIFEFSFWSCTAKHVKVKNECKLTLLISKGYIKQMG